MGRNCRWFLVVAALGWVLAASIPRYGSEFALYEAGARSISLAGVVVARADAFSAIFYNPAGLVQIQRFYFIGRTAFIPRAKIITHLRPVATTSQMHRDVLFAPLLFISYQVIERVWVVLGLNSAFGLDVRCDPEISRYMELAVKAFSKTEINLVGIGVYTAFG